MESTSNRVFRYLLEHPTLMPANMVGDPIYEPDSRNHIGILFNDPTAKNPSWFQRLIGGKHKPDFLGILFFYVPGSNAGDWVPGGHVGDWCLKFMREDQRLMAMIVANELRDMFRADVRHVLNEHDAFHKTLFP